MSQRSVESPELAREIVDTLDGAFLSQHETWGTLLADKFSKLQERGEGDFSDDVVDYLLCCNSNNSGVADTDTGDSSAVPLWRLSLAEPSSGVDTGRGPRHREPKLSTRRSTQHRRRAEIHSLRAKAVELESQLEMIKSSKRLEERNDCHQVYASLWRTITHRQQQLRIVSQSTRKKLRTRIDAQIEVAREMVELIRKARRMEKDGLVPSGATPHMLIAGAVDIAESDQIKRIHAVHEALDVVFSGPNFHAANVNVADIQLLQDLPNQFIIVACETWAVPFEQQRTINAVWDFCVKRQQNKWCAPALVQDTRQHVEETELIAEFSAVTTLDSTSGRFNGRSIVKRFVGSASAIISDVCWTPSKSDPGAFAGLCVHELSCVRVVPVMARATNGSSRPEISHVQLSQRVTITFAGASHREHAGLFADLALATLRECIEIMHETVETKLLLASSAPTAY